MDIPWNNPFLTTYPYHDPQWRQVGLILEKDKKDHLDERARQYIRFKSVNFSDIRWVAQRYGSYRADELEILINFYY